MVKEDVKEARGREGPRIPFGCAYQPHCPARRGVSSVLLKTSTTPSCPPRLFYEVFWDAVTACNVGFGLPAYIATYLRQRLRRANIVNRPMAV